MTMVCGNSKGHSEGRKRFDLDGHWGLFSGNEHRHRALRHTIKGSIPVGTFWGPKNGL